jgi:hypothetical protein
MSKELLKVALKHPEKVASPLAKSLVTAAGSGLGAAGAFKLLSALRPELAEAALWGGTTAGGVLGHDLAGLLARKKIAYASKKRAAMVKEAPYKKEYSLTKRANLSRAAKGAIALPAAVGTVGAMMPAKALGLASTLASHGKQIDPSILQKFLQPSKQLGELISAGHLPAGPDALLGLSTLAALGAGAGKLSERVKADQLRRLLS